MNVSILTRHSRQTLLLAALLMPSALLAQTTLSWTTGVVYEYDGSGNIRKMGTDAYVYDSANRLVRESVAGVQQTYTYDAFGNRTGCTQAGGDCQSGMTIDSATNRIQHLSYDARGNLTQLPEGHTLTYDDVGMLAREGFVAGSREYIYTADDERLAVHSTFGSESSWTWTVRGLDKKVLREFTSSDAGGVGTGDFRWSKDYIWRDGTLLATRQRDSTAAGTPVVTYHYHVDHLGTPRMVTDAAGTIIGRHEYHAFGVEANGNVTEPVSSRMKFTGHERDTYPDRTWPLDYMHARYYDGRLGRFLSVDPVLNKGALRKPQLWNRYSYVSNNPLNFVDPDGRLLQLSGCVKDQNSDACKGQMNMYLSTFGKPSGEAAKYLTVGKNGIVGFNGISGSAFAAKFGLMGRATNYLVSNRAATFSLEVGRTAKTEAHRGAYFDGDNRVGGVIGIDPSRFPNSKHFFGITVSAPEALAHEIGHAVGSLIPGHAYAVAMQKAIRPIAQIGWDETYASAFQNAWRHEVLGVSTYRSGYSLVPHEFRDSTTADVYP